MQRSNTHRTPPELAILLASTLKITGSLGHKELVLPETQFHQKLFLQSTALCFHWKPVQFSSVPQMCAAMLVSYRLS